MYLPVASDEGISSLSDLFNRPNGGLLLFTSLFSIPDLIKVLPSSENCLFSFLKYRRAVITVAIQS